MRVVDAVVRAWPTMKRRFERSPYSVSLPVPDGSGSRALKPQFHFSELPPIRAARRSHARFVLQADISRFYHSIYTHAIPWALHTKKKAKLTLGRRKGQSESIGDAIDRTLRNGQDRQTLGLPIGPDTSLVLSELILAAADIELSKRLPDVVAFRHYDDYELYFATKSEAESAIVILQEVLGSYELDLGPHKTRILSLPLPHENPWTSAVRNLSQTISTYTITEIELIRYFDRVFEIAEQNAESHVLSYAVSRLQRRVREESWKLLQSLLFQVVLAEPGTFRHVVQHFIDAEASQWQSELDELGNVMNIQIVYHAPLGHGSEVAWALWTLGRFRRRLSRSARDAIAEMKTDSVVALLALRLREQDLSSGRLDSATWRSKMTRANLYGPNWLLAYEAGVKGWLPSRRNSDHIAQDPAFSELRRLGVSFFDSARTLTPNPDLLGEFGDNADDLLRDLESFSDESHRFSQ
jgi:hypothetical protein